MKVNTNAPSHSGATPAAVDKTQGLSQKDKNSGAEKAGKSGVSQSASQIDISDDAKLMQQARDIVKSLPENPQAERVAALKKSVRDGSYTVDAAKVADRLLEEQIGSHFGKNGL